jgi:DNA invertase Pin-like site-specific DNA recombinase
MKGFICYYRVSTARQGASGLGLDGQRSTVQKFCADGQIIGEFTDVESGKNDNRPELLKAIAAAKEHGATLVIAKLDRLSRNLTFISSLMDSGAKFVCCDMPQANEFTIHIFAALAQQERKMISERTKAGLAAKRERIEKGDYVNAKPDASGNIVAMKPDKQGRYRLGSPKGFTDTMRERAAEVNRKKAQENEAVALAKRAIWKELQYNPKASLSQLAEELNAQKLRTPTGKPFTRYAVAYMKRSL